MKSHHGIIRNCAIIDFNPAEFSVRYHWVLFVGSDNRVEKCYFEGKTNAGALVQNGEAEGRRNSLTGCYFKDIPLIPNANGREIVKVLGPGHVDASSPDGAYFTLDGNLFEHADGEGVEIISLKSNHNLVSRNTVISSAGCLNIRRGSYNVVEGNIILGNGRKECQGIRMAGSHNLVKGNYISGCKYGIAVSSGEYWNSPLTPEYVVNDREGNAPNKARYPQNVDVTIRDNMTVGIRTADLDIGVCEYKKHWPENQNVLLPEECRIENNTFVRQNGGISVIGMLPDSTPPLNRFSFKPNTFVGNILYGGTNEFAAASSGCQEIAVPEGWSEVSLRSKWNPHTSSTVGPDWLRNKDP
jgi:poly(beta-D-mannuronate) lyase